MRETDMLLREQMTRLEGEWAQEFECWWNAALHPE